MEAKAYAILSKRDATDYEVDTAISLALRHGYVKVLIKAHSMGLLARAILMKEDDEWHADAQKYVQKFRRLSEMHYGIEKRLVSRTHMVQRLDMDADDPWVLALQVLRFKFIRNLIGARGLQPLAVSKLDRATKAKDLHPVYRSLCAKAVEQLQDGYAR